MSDSPLAYIEREEPTLADQDGEAHFLRYAMRPSTIGAELDALNSPIDLALDRSFVWACNCSIDAHETSSRLGGFRAPSG